MSRIFLSPQTSHGLHDQGFIWRGKVTPARGPLKLLAGMDAARPGHVGGNSPSVFTRARGPNNVRVADVWTPSAGADGWAIPADMPGPCGIHPGQEFQWATSWSHFASPYEALVMQAVRGQW